MHALVVNIRSGQPFDVYVGRGRDSKWGNPYMIGRDGTREEVIEKYRQWLLSQPALVEEVKRELAGKVLGCFCAPFACHAEILAEIAGGGPPEEMPSLYPKKICKVP
jgi:hypothetical protein